MSLGALYVVFGPSGAGKSTVCKLVRERLGINLSISATSRKPRNGEQEGVDYFFITAEEFERKIENKSPQVPSSPSDYEAEQVIREDPVPGQRGRAVGLIPEEFGARQHLEDVHRGEMPSQQAYASPGHRQNHFQRKPSANAINDPPFRVHEEPHPPETGSTSPRDPCRTPEFDNHRQKRIQCPQDPLVPTRPSPR